MFGNRSGRVCRPGGLRKRRPGQGRAAGQQVRQGRQRPRPPPWLPGGSSLGRTERCPRSAPSLRRCEGGGVAASASSVCRRAALSGFSAGGPRARPPPAHGRCGVCGEKLQSGQRSVRCILPSALGNADAPNARLQPGALYRLPPLLQPCFHIRVRCSRRRGSVAILFSVRSPPCPELQSEWGGAEEGFCTGKFAGEVALLPESLGASSAAAAAAVAAGTNAGAGEESFFVQHTKRIG